MGDRGSAPRGLERPDGEVTPAAARALRCQLEGLEEVPA
jgi:hypothetical protein